MKRSLTVLLVIAAIFAGFSAGWHYRTAAAEREIATVTCLEEASKAGLFVGLLELIEAGDDDRARRVVHEALSGSVSGAFYASQHELVLDDVAYPNILDSLDRTVRFFEGQPGAELLHERARLTRDKLRESAATR